MRPERSPITANMALRYVINISKTATTFFEHAYLEAKVENANANKQKRDGMNVFGSISPYYYSKWGIPYWIWILFESEMW